MHTVLSLIKYLRSRRLEYFVCYLHVCQIEALTHFLSNLCLKIMECRQTVKENCFLPCILHNCRGYLVWCQIMDSLFPYCIRLTHGYPYICVNNVCVLRSSLYILCKSDGCAGLCCVLFALSNQLLIREIFLTCAGYEMHTKLGAGYHQGVTHVVTGIAHVYQLDSFQISEMLTDGKHIC